MESFSSLSAIRDGHLATVHSLGPNPKNTLSDVRYLLFSPHDHWDETGDDPMGIGRIPNELMARLEIEDSLLGQYLESERDKGVSPPWPCDFGSDSWQIYLQMLCRLD